MKVLSFTLTEELLAVGESCAIASPAKLKDATARARMQILEIVVSVFFITFPVDARRSTGQSRIENSRPSGRGKFRSLLRESACHAANCGTKAGPLDRSGLRDRSE